MKSTGRFLLLVLALLQAPSLVAESLEQRLKRNAGDQYQTPAPAKIAKATELFTQNFQGNFGRKQLATWKTIGFISDSLTRGPHSYAVIEEEPGKRQQAGFFVFRKGVAKAVVLQAPHRFFDTYTDVIGIQLFEEHPFHAAAWNTTHRNYGDLAHENESYFQAFTKAFATYHPQGYLLQIHSFSKKKRKTARGRMADMIISNGTRYPNAKATKLRSCLDRRLPTRFKIFLYPKDVTELGATTNTQGRLLRALRHDGFLHMEMSKELRLELKGSAKLRQIIWDCLAPADKTEGLPKKPTNLRVLKAPSESVVR